MMQNNNMKIEKAVIGNEKDILKLYRSNIGQNGCTWDNEYPNMDCIMNDIKLESLYCLKNKKNHIVAVATLEKNKDLEDLNNWDKNATNQYLLTRFGVERESQGQGISKILLEQLFRQAIKKNCNLIYLLVDKNNIKAKKLYEKMGFEYCGEVNKYSNKWDAMQKRM